MPLQQALKLAEEKELDLVEISPNSNPPVCKIVDYGKFMYQIKKKSRASKEEKTAKKKSVTKEIRIGYKIAQHDLENRLEKVKEFLKEGNKVKVVLIMRGRERAYASLAMDKIKTDVIEKLQDIAEVEKGPFVEGGGRQVSVFLKAK